MSRFLWAVESCGCIHESGFDLESLHVTKRGAARAMNALKSEMHEKYTSSAEDFEDEIYLIDMRREPQFYEFEAFRYRKVEVEE